ncbi:MAG: hypothetical protein ACOYIK_03480 [Coriobacteriales bacterium]|jgi:hypothetical protein
MSDIKSRVHDLSMDLPSRDVGSRGEELASETLADDLYSLGLQTDIDGFTCPGNLRISRSIYFALELIAALICVFSPSMRVLALVLGIVGLVMLYISYTKLDPLGSLFSKYDSQNVVARYIPEGLGNSPRRGKIVITAHYDVKKPSLFQIPAIRRFYPIVRKVLIGADIAVPVCTILAMLPFPEIVSTIFAVIGLIAGIIALIQIVDQVLGAFLKTPKGSNNNASGLAVMYALAEKMVTADVKVPVSPEETEREIEHIKSVVDKGESESRVASPFPQDVIDLSSRAQEPSSNAEDELPVQDVVPAENAPDRDQAGVAAQEQAAAPVQTAEEIISEKAQLHQAESGKRSVPVQYDQANMRNSKVIPRESRYEPINIPDSGQRATSESSAAVRAAEAAASGAETSRPARKSSAPSWWAKVEEEKSRGEFKQAEETPTLRSRFADAPAYKEMEEREKEPEAEVPAAAGAEEVSSEPAAEPVETSPIEASAAPSEEPSLFSEDQQETVEAEAEEAASSVVAAQPPVQEPDSSDNAVQAEGQASASGAVDTMVPSVEGAGTNEADADSTIAYTPEPIDKAVAGFADSLDAKVQQAQQKISETVQSEPEPVGRPVVAKEYEDEPRNPEHEDLKNPSDNPDWPSGAYKYSRTRRRYVSDPADRQSYGTYDSMEKEPQTDMIDYSRMNYPNGDNRSNIPEIEKASIADPNVTAVAVPKSEDETSRGRHRPSKRNVSDESSGSRYSSHRNSHRRTAVNVPDPDATAAVPAVDAGEENPHDSLLNLPVVGSSETDLSISKDRKQKGLDTSVNREEDSLDSFDDVSDSPENLTGSFAPLGATGVMKPVTAEMLEQYNDGNNMYVEDADDSGYDDQYSDQGTYMGSVSLDMPKKKRFSFRKNKKKSKRKSSRRAEEETSSPSEWLGVDSDYNATDEGAQIGSWDNFDDDDWDGGAYGAASEERNRDAIAALSDELLNKEVWFVALGASDAANFGMRSLLKARSGDLRHSRIINLEGIGSGSLRFTSSEPELFMKKRTDSRLQKIMHKASRAARVDIEPMDLNWRTTDATFALDKGARAITITAVDENGVTPGWKWSDDIEDIVDEKNLDDVFRLMIEFIKAC